MSAKQPPSEQPAHPLQVVIRCLESGLYLKRLDHHPDYTASFVQAQVFDYVQDQVPFLIQDVRKNLGQYWQAVPLRISDALETCDVCHGLFGVPDICYTGSQFLCPQCGTVLNNPAGRANSAAEERRERRP